MMQGTVRFSAIAAITWLLSAAVLISAAHFNAAQAQGSSKKDRAAVNLRPRTEKAVQRCASAGKQHARMSQKGASTTHYKMRCTGE